MNPIPEQVVEQVWERVAALPETGAEKLTTRMGQEQPALVGYLLAVDQDILSQEEREVLFYLGLVIWQIMSDGSKLPPAAIEVVERADDANAEMLEQMLADPEADLQAAAENLINTYHQSAVLGYAVGALVEAADAQEIRADNIGVMLIDLKTVVDCLDQ
ncbi:MAG: hypothetical protein WCF84_05425 [Anaerolineae bacterium]